MNSLTIALGPHSAAAADRVSQTIAQHHGATAQTTMLHGGKLVSARAGDVLLHCAQDGDMRLWLLGTLFGDTPGWTSDLSPLDDGAPAARWLLERYRAAGRTFLDGVIGQYVVIVSDPAEDLLLAAVDPFGGRGLFALEADGMTGFSTRLDLAGALCGDALAVDREWEDFFLIHGFHPHGRTVYRGVRALAAAELLELRGGEWTCHTVAQPDWSERDPAQVAASLSSEGAAAAELEAMFLNALASQLPRRKQAVGVLLGGFDSALVAATIARLGYPVVTYSFRYAGAGYNQPHTDTLADHIGCDHRWIDIDKAMIEQGLEQFAHLFNQPTNWPNYVIQTLRVVERMRADGISFCYSGDGCDAAFLGYPGTYARARLIGRLPSLPRPLHRLLLGLAARPALERLLGHPWRVALGLLRAMGRPTFARDYLSFRIFDEVSLRQLKPGEPVQSPEAEIATLSRPHAGLSGVRRTYLGKAAVSPNRSKMIASADATGVPILAPYMHPALKRFALALPLDLLRPEDGGPATGKAVLGAMAIRSGLLPASIVNQPKMAAVDAPVDEWYAGPLRQQMMVFLGDLPFAADRGYLSRLLDLKVAERQFKARVMTDKVISHAPSLLATYARFAALAKR